LNKHRTVPLDIIPGSTYAKVLTYPALDETVLRARLTELAAAGVGAVRFVGPSSIDGLQILGKGCVGLVTEALLEGQLVALKVRRVDADRPSMYEEARLLRLANAVGVGPRLITATRNFLVMELFDGVPLFKWATRRRRATRSVGEVLSGLLNACFRLDAVGLDHGELSRAPKNVLVGVDGDACIVDFESASMVRRVSNVTSLIQYFLFGSISKALRTSSMFPNRRGILRALSQYKQSGSVDSYLEVLGRLGLKDYYGSRFVSAEGGAVV
jgi:putative serine/threonine protein kinase